MTASPASSLAPFHPLAVLDHHRRVRIVATGELGDVVSVGTRPLVRVYHRPAPFCTGGAYKVKAILEFSPADLAPCRGRPYLVGIDPARIFAKKGKGKSAPAPAPAAATPVAPVVPTVPTVTPTVPTVTPEDVAERLREALAGLLAGSLGSANVDAETVRAIVREELGSAPRAVIARARAAAAVAGTGDPIRDILAPYYPAPGAESPANVLLCSPAGYGKSFSVRELGRGYDEYREHGCTDDVEEIATLIGTVLPNGSGGFVAVDGVVTESVRLAAAGKTVLLFLDELLRLGTRPQEWLLTFLTGAKDATGAKVYRLRTRTFDPSTGTYEIIECPAERLHIVAAANLEIRTPSLALWDRFAVERLEYSPELMAKVGASVLASYGVADAGNVLATAYAATIGATRDHRASAALLYPASIRLLERAAQLAGPDRATVAAFAGSKLAGTCSGWNGDTGNISTDAVKICETLAATLLATVSTAS